MKIIAIFNPTIESAHQSLLVDDLARKFVNRNKNKVLMVDFSPLSLLTKILSPLPILPKQGGIQTIFDGISPILDGTGDVAPIEPILISSNLWLLAGNRDILDIEERLSVSWSDCLSRDLRALRAFRITTCFYKLLLLIGEQLDIDVCFMDVGYTFGALNRSLLLAANEIILPFHSTSEVPDKIRTLILNDIKAIFAKWRAEWSERKEVFDMNVKRFPDFKIPTLPPGEMKILDTF